MNHLNFFFFFKDRSYVKVKLNIRFETSIGKNPTIEDLSHFLGALSAIHEEVIVHTQKEYTATKKHQQSLQILEYHKLDVIHICRKNPFDLELTFFILREGLLTYWPLIKALFKFCKRYGRNHNTLSENAELLHIFIRTIFEKFRNRNITIDSVEEDSFDNLTKLYYSLMQNDKFKKIYDIFCRTSLSITSIVSKVEDFDEIDLLND